MTRAETQEILQEIKRYLTAGNPVWHKEVVAEALDMAIEALQNLSKPNNGLQGSDLISRNDAIDAFGLSEKTRKYGGDHSGYNTMMLYEIQDVLESLQSADRSTEWIPFTKRPLTDEEKEEYPDWIYIFDCPLPDDGQEILLSNGKYVWTDTFFNDDGCYLDGGDDIDEGMAWMPMPELYKERNE